jgi:hypothetical protein
MAQDVYPQTYIAEQSSFDSFISQLNELAAGGTATGLFNNWYQPLFSPEMSTQLSLDDIMHDFSSDFPPY